MPARAFMRYRSGEPVESTVRFDPVYPEHPCYNDDCPACGLPLAEGGARLRLRARLRLLEMDVEDSYKYKAGRWINTPADIIHDECAHTRPTVDAQRTVTVVRVDA